MQAGWKTYHPHLHESNGQGQTNRVSGVIGKAGADFKREFTLETYRQFFADAGYSDMRFELCEGGFLRGGTDSHGRICGHKEEITITIVIQLALHCFLLWLIAIGMLWVGRSKFWMIPKMEKGRAAQCT